MKNVINNKDSNNSLIVEDLYWLSIEPDPFDFLVNDVVSGTDAHLSTGSGDDTITLSEGDGHTAYQVVRGGDGTDTVIFEGNRGDYTVTHEDGNGRFVMKNIATGEANYIYDDVETIQFADQSIATFTDGAPTTTLVNDVVSGTDAHLSTGSGDDTITLSEGEGHTAYQVVRGGDGTDTVIFEGNRGDYTVTHEDGNGRFVMKNIATGEANYIYDDVETIQFSDQSIATFIDGAPTTTLVNDVVSGTDAHLSTGSGDDTITLSEGDGHTAYQVVRGGDGTDTVIFEGNRGDYTVTHEDGNGRFVMKNIATGEANYIYDDVETIQFSDQSIATFTDGAPTTTLVNDVISGTDAHLSTGSGDDTITLSEGEGHTAYQVVRGGDGTDTVIFEGNRMDYTVTHEDANGRFKMTHVETGEANYIYDDVETIQFADASVATFTGAEPTPLLVSNEPSYNEIRGTSLSETINGTDRSDHIWGERGNDTINAGEGNDIIEGGDGYDTLNGGAGNDSFIQNEGDDYDVFNGGEGTDKVSRGTGDGNIGIKGNFSTDNSIEEIDAKGSDIYGDSNSNTLDFSGTQLTDVEQINGGRGNDSITGTAGDDIIVGGDGYDTLNGGAGNDSFIQNEGDDYDVFNGGEGTDKVSRGTGDGNIGIKGNFSTDNSIEEIDAKGSDIYGDSNSNTLDFSGTRLTDVEQINGGRGNDSITGTAGDDIIVGGDGYDTLNGGAGNDSFIQNEGDDYDVFNGGEGTDKVSRGTGDGNIGIKGNFSTDNSIEEIDAKGSDIYGDSNSNTLDFSGTRLTDVEQINGGRGNDSITGTAGDDIIVGGDGYDTLNGGAGNDSFIQNEGDDYDVFNGGEGTDKVSRGTGDGNIGIKGNFSTDNSIEEIDAKGSDIYGDSNSNTLDFSGTRLTDVEQINGGRGNDSITGTAGDDIIVGGDGYDTLNGGAGNDSFIQNEGDDYDVFNGGEGTDKVSRGTGDGNIGIKGNFSTDNSIEEIDAKGSDIYGDSNSNTLDFSGTRLTDVNEINAGRGNDSITGSSGDDTVIGDGGSDTYFFGAFDGEDTFNGGEGWTDTISLDATDSANPDAPWTIMVDGEQVAPNAGESFIDFGEDTSGVVTMADGSSLSFENVEKVEW